VRKIRGRILVSRGQRAGGAQPATRDRLLDKHRFRSLGEFVVGNLDRIADVDDVGN
jgi:hypothetical protein